MSDFPEKYNKKLPPNFTEEIDSMKEEDIKTKVFSCEEQINSIEKAMASDVKLNAAKEVMKDLSKSYRDSKSIETAKIKYCLHVLESRGKI